MNSFIDSILDPFLDMNDFLPQTLYSGQMRNPLGLIPSVDLTPSEKEASMH